MPNASRNIAPAIRPENKPFSIIIPAAGLGRRMKSYGPKSLININGTTVLDNQLAHINSNFPHSEIIIVSGHQSTKLEKIYAEKRNIKLVRNPLYETTNVTSSVGVGLREASYKKVLVVYGDLVFNESTLTAPFGNYSMVLTGFNNMKDSEVGCIAHNHTLESMSFDLPEKWYQIALFCGKELELLHKICDNRKYDMYFGFEIINIILNSGGRFTTYSPKDAKIVDIDSSKDIKLAEEII